MRARLVLASKLTTLTAGFASRLKKENYCKLGFCYCIKPVIFLLQKYVLYNIVEEAAITSKINLVIRSASIMYRESMK